MEKYYYQLILLKYKLIINNIDIYNIINHIPGQGTNFSFL